MEKSQWLAKGCNQEKGCTQKRVHTKKSKVAQARSPDVIDELVENDELKDRQKAFCLYYLQRYNATWAYQKAYGADYSTAGRNGHRLLK